MLDKMLNRDRTGLRVRGISESIIPFPPKGPTSIDSILGQLEKNPEGRFVLRNSPAETIPYNEPSLLFHEGGFTPVQVRVFAIVWVKFFIYLWQCWWG